MGGMAEPLMDIVVNGTPLKPLVDTGATYSTVISGTIRSAYLSNKTVSVMGFSGEIEKWPVTKQLPTQVANQLVSHSFLYSSNAPVPLMGRDLLTKLGASILCSPDGIVVRFPDGHTVNCSLSSTETGNQWMLVGGKYKESVDIYWAELEVDWEDEMSSNSVVSLYNTHKSWIQDRALFLPPIDPLHCTMFYDRFDTTTYEELFMSIEGTKWRLVDGGMWYICWQTRRGCTHIFVRRPERMV